MQWEIRGSAPIEGNAYARPPTLDRKKAVHAGSAIAYALKLAVASRICAESLRLQHMAVDASMSRRRESAISSGHLVTPCHI